MFMSSSFIKIKQFFEEKKERQHLAMNKFNENWEDTFIKKKKKKGEVEETHLVERVSLKWNKGLASVLCVT